MLVSLCTCQKLCQKFCSFLTISFNQIKDYSHQTWSLSYFKNTVIYNVMTVCKSCYLTLSKLNNIFRLEAELRQKDKLVLVFLAAATAQAKQLAVLGSSGCNVQDTTSPTRSTDCSALVPADNNNTIPCCSVATGAPKWSAWGFLDPPGS